MPQMPDSPVGSTNGQSELVGTPHKQAWYWRLLGLYDKQTHATQYDTDGEQRSDAEEQAQEWWRRLFHIAGSRLERYRIFEEMDGSGMVSSFLDIYAEEATQPDHERGRHVWIESKNEKMIKAGNECLHNIMIEDRGTPLVRRMCKMGDGFQRNIYQAGKGVIGWKYCRTDKMHRVEDKYGRLVGFRQDGVQFRNGKRATSWPWDYTHFRLLGKDEETGYGTALLDTWFNPWRTYTLSMDAVLMYRLRRAPDRNMVLVDVGNMEESEAMDYVNQFKKAFRKNEFIDPACITLDTKIRTLSGTMTLQQIIAACAKGADVWVYGYDEHTRETLPGRVSWAGVTRKNAEVVEVQIADGTIITCTPDHPVATMGETVCWVHAGELTVGAQLVSLRPGKPLAPDWRHVVKAVRSVSSRVDTGDLTVPVFGNFFVADASERGGVLVHNSPNYRKQFNPLTPWEDVFLPVRGADSETRIEPMSGAGNAGEIQDVDMNRKIFCGVAKIPAAYIGFESDVSAKATLLQQDVRFARTIKRIQKAYKYGIRQTLDIHYTLLAVSNSDYDPTAEENRYLVCVPPSSYLDELERLELIQLRSELMGAMAQFGQTLGVNPKVWSVYILTQYAKLPEDVVLRLLSKEVAGPEATSVTGGGNTPEESLTNQKAILEAARMTGTEGYYCLSSGEKKRIAESIHRSPALRKIIGDIAEAHLDDQIVQQTDPSTLPPLWMGQDITDGIEDSEERKQLNEDLETLRAKKA